MEIDYTQLVELNPNPPCISCGKPIQDNYGFAVADLFCCVVCYDGFPVWAEPEDED
jgi:hypothetical protein